MTRCAPLAALLAVGLAALTACSGSSGAASCVGGLTSVEPTAVRAGETVTVTGRFFLEGCDDLGTGESFPPRTNEPVTWRQGDVERELARVDADSQGSITIKVTIPADATPGAAEMEIGASQPAVVTVVVAP